MHRKQFEVHKAFTGSVVDSHVGIRPATDVEVTGSSVVEQTACQGQEEAVGGAGGWGIEEGPGAHINAASR